MLVAKNIEKSFGSLKVLKNISVEIKKNEIVSIIGASGAGKTTLLHILGTLEKPDSGKVLYDGKDIFLMNDKQKSTFRNNEIGFVFQFHHLLPEFNAIENIMLPALINGDNNKNAKNKSIELMELLGIEKRKFHKPLEMSGGEQQRVALARALINSPKILMADEPTGNLDSENSKEIYRLFKYLRDNHNQTIVVITHNHEFASIADRVLEMKDGSFINN